jgi:subtilisin family serine protease
MHLRTGSKPDRKIPIGPLLLLALGIAAVGLSMTGKASAVDRWKHPPVRAAVGQYHGVRFGPNVSGPNAAESNSRAEAVAGPDKRREGGGNIQAEGRPLELNRPTLNPTERGGAELQRLDANPAGRGPAESQRQGPGSLPQNAGQRGPFQRGQAAGGFARQAGGFARRALAGRTRPGAGGFARGPLAGRFQGRPFAAALVRRPMIGERGFTGVPAAGETRFLTNEMVFHVPPNVSPQTVDTVARRLGLSTVASQSFNLSGGTLFRFRITDGRPVADVIRALESENIGVAQPNYVFRLQQDATLAGRSTPGDPSQYVVDKLRLVDVHRIAIGSNVLVAVIDSQVDGKHPELAGAVVDEFDPIRNRDKPHVHGTGMAGAIAAHRRLVGIAPGVRLLAIHAFSSSGTDSAQATSEHILMGIDWAIRKGAQVINMSFAGPDDPMLQLALQKAHDKGVVLIAAAGNLGPKSPPLYPAADPNVIAVTATDAKDQLLAQANQGAYVAVAAPGVDILEPAPNGGYQVTTGTSVAAAHVSGIVALLIDHDPTLDAAAIREILTTSAKHHTPKGRDDQFGWGEVDPFRALTAPATKVARDRPKDPATDGAAATPRPVSAR